MGDVNEAVDIEILGDLGNEGWSVSVNVVEFIVPADQISEDGHSHAED